MTEKGARSNANDHLSSQSGYNFEIHFVKASGIRLNFKYLKICGQVRGGYQTLVFEYVRKKKKKNRPPKNLSSYTSLHWVCLPTVDFLV